MQKIYLFAAILALSMVSVAQPVRFGTRSEDKPLKIVKKPKPSSHGCTEDKGSIVLRATFESTGKVGDVVVVTSSPCASFNESALTAAHDIEFEPEVRDGRSVTVSKQIEYVFTRY